MFNDETLVRVIVVVSGFCTSSNSGVDVDSLVAISIVGNVGNASSVVAFGEADVVVTIGVVVAGISTIDVTTGVAVASDSADDVASAVVSAVIATVGAVSNIVAAVVSTNDESLRVDTDSYSTDDFVAGDVSDVVVVTVIDTCVVVEALCATVDDGSGVVSVADFTEDAAS